jgi:hypothetical protein
MLKQRASKSKRRLVRGPKQALGGGRRTIKKLVSTQMDDQGMNQFKLISPSNNVQS